MSNSIKDEVWRLCEFFGNVLFVSSQGFTNEFYLQGKPLLKFLNFKEEGKHDRY